MSNPYPDRDLEELYLENISIWEEVAAGTMTVFAALSYMRVEPDSEEWERAKYALKHFNPFL